MRIAIDFDLPAPKSPWIHRSSRLVSQRHCHCAEVCLRHVRPAQRQRIVPWSGSRGEARPPRDMELALGVATGRTNARNVIFCCPPFLPLPFGHYRCLIPGGICTGGFARTAASSRVGLVHPNIHIVCRKKVSGTGLFCPWTVASMGSQVLAGGTIPILEGFKLFLCKKIQWLALRGRQLR